MKNYVQPGNTITLTAPYAVTSGDGLLVGSIFGVAAGNAILGDPVETAVEGVYDLKKVASQAWAAGDLATGEALSREALSMNEELGDALGATLSRNNLAWIAMERGDS